MKDYDHEVYLAFSYTKLEWALLAMVLRDADISCKLSDGGDYLLDTLANKIEDAIE